MTGDGTKTYQWDAENRLVAVLQGATILASFTYDGASRRAARSAGGVTHSYVHDGQGVIEDRVGGTQVFDYVQGAGVDQTLAQRDQTSAVSYYVADHLGSIAQVTNSSGAVALTREYDPWGSPLQGGASAGYAFTGREWDSETGLYYYRARYYDPKAARFLSEDPLEVRARSQQQMNDYAYVGNRPVTLTDPFGLDGDLPGYVHSSIPELTVNDGRVRSDETQGTAGLVKETDTACFYATGSLTRFAAALIGLTKSRIQTACKIKRPICCPPIQAFFVSRSADAVVIGRVNVYCDKVPRKFDEWRKYE